MHHMKSTQTHKWICAFTSSDEQVQLDFMEMLRVRDEKRRMRQVEAIIRQKELEDEGAAHAVKGDSGRKGGEGGGGGGRVEMMEDQGEVFSPPKLAPKPRSPKNTALHKESSSTSSDTIASDRQVRQTHMQTLHTWQQKSCSVNVKSDPKNTHTQTDMLIIHKTCSFCSSSV